MPVPLVNQLMFARSEFARSLDGVSATDAVSRLEPFNCLSWILGHLASQEQTYWVLIAQGKSLYPDLHRIVGTGSPASTPPFEEMWTTWREVTAAANTFLQALTLADLTRHMEWKGQPRPESIGTMLERNLYHYWIHLGEILTIRSAMGHQNIPNFIGDMTAAAYTPEN